MRAAPRAAAARRAACQRLDAPRLPGFARARPAGLVTSAGVLVGLRNLSIIFWVRRRFAVLGSHAPDCRPGENGVSMLDVSPAVDDLRPLASGLGLNNFPFPSANSGWPDGNGSFWINNTDRRWTAEQI